MPVYNGNAVGYGSGGQWYVQVEVWDNGGGPGPQVTVFYSYKIYFSTSISDSSNVINWSDPWGSGSADNRAFNGAGTHVVSGTHQQLANIDYGVNNRLHFRMYATGMAAGGTGPSVVEFDYLLPARTPSLPGPTNTFVSGVTATSVNVSSSWGDTGGGFIDTVMYGIRSGVDGSTVGTDQQGAWGGVTFNGLARGTLYYAYSRAHSREAGWGPWSSAVAFYTSSSAPSSPGTLTSSGVTQTTANVNWVAPDNGGSGLSGFHIQVDDDPGFSSPLLDANSPSTHTSRAVAGLALNTTYYARVRTWNANGYSGWSPTLTFKTTPGVPAAPAAPTFTGVTGVSGVMNWTTPANNGAAVDGFYIQMDDDPAFASPVVDGTTGANIFLWQANGLIPNRVYYARVRAKNSVGYGPYSAVNSFRTNAGLYVSVGGTTKEAQLYISVGGVPKLAEVYVSVDGTPRLV